MDIPQVLARLHPGKYGGPMASSSSGYGDFSEHWPTEINGPVPTEAEMEAVWTQIEADRPVKKTKVEVEGEIDTFLNGAGGTKKALKLLLFEVFRSTPGRLKEHGINIEGELDE